MSAPAHLLRQLPERAPDLRTLAKALKPVPVNAGRAFGDQPGTSAPGVLAGLERHAAEPCGSQYKLCNRANPFGTRG